MRAPRFLFLGNRLAVDCLNTWVEMDGSRRELLADAGELAAWAEAAGVVSARGLRAALRGGAEPQAFREFRGRLGEALRAWRQSRPLSRQFLGLVNRHLAGEPETLAVGRRGTGAGRSLALQRHSSGSPLARLYAAVSRSLAEMLVSDDRRRYRRCTNPGCNLVFYDVSKAGRRRWCAMKVCGARAKVRAYYWRHRPAPTGRRARPRVGPVISRWHRRR